MENSTEVTLEQMSETRAALSDKLNALEDQVLGTVQETKHTVAETVETVKDAVESTVTTIKDSVKQSVECVQDSLNLSRHVRNYPWLAMGGAVAVGFLSSRLLPDTATAPGRFTPSAMDGHAGPSYEHPEQSQPYQAAALPSSRGQATGHSLTDTLGAALHEPLHKLTGLAIGAAMGLVGEMVHELAPPALKQQLCDVIDEVTVNFGGKPVHGLWHLQSEHDARECETHAASQPATQW